jgi:flagellum-specific peptidoglycan hydrolase FlgJ
MTSEEFYISFRPFAKMAALGTKIFPEVILAAASLESRNGNSQLSKKYKNYFGIKANKNSKNKIAFKTQEFIKGKEVTILQYFKVYASVLESFKDYIMLLYGPRYVKSGVLTARNVIDQIKAIKKGGYATDPQYVNKLVSLYEKNKKPVVITGGILIAVLGAYTIYKIIT